ncbi:Aspartic proteinase nepenthesin-2 precursor, putative [Ricinus communis]|uniref:Aspartic proteinase nepenthesin-2, putative n=2 Tax=Ricinus communis TaxID=3988 RepID=B9RNR7_RICCO|nr:Aspartic proteinase nepenthesin-2 precursor, putative [Ricinus communis]
MLLQDQLRVKSMHARFSNKNAGSHFKEMQADIPVQSGIPLGAGNYLVKMALGTPKLSLSLALDTGSDITWTQCEPCVGSCYRQAQTKFDPRKSSSYKNVSCSSSSCRIITDSGGARGCVSSTCIYKVQYGDGSYSVGFFATEKLTISPSDVISNFLFGCGQQNAGRFGRIAGLLGLGRGKLSLALQTSEKYNNLFTYCLPSFSSSSTGHLTLGGQVPKSVKFTPLSPAFKNTPFYGIDIKGLSVGGHVLPIDASVFSNAGAIIDSGTVITRLQPTVYSALSSKFQQLMKDYPKTDGFSILDTCYDFSGNESISVPRISFFFKGGVEVDIKFFGILTVINAWDKVCLAFAPNDDDGDFVVFGNSQQQTYDVVHDLAKGRIGFAPSGCN